MNNLLEYCVYYKHQGTSMLLYRTPIVYYNKCTYLKLYSIPTRAAGFYKTYMKYFK